MSYFVTVGILLGLSAGVAPGPLLTLVVSETLSGGVGAGVRVALSPLLSDLPIILFAVFFVSQFSEVQILLGAMSILGGFFVFYMGYESLRTEKINDDVLTPEEAFLHATTETQEAIARGWAGNYGDRARSQFESLEKYKKALTSRLLWAI